MALHAPLGLASAVLIAGSLVLLWFVVLAGVKDRTPLRHTYFLRADTSGMTGALDVSQWTFFYICGRGNTDCGRAHPAPPFGSAWDGHATGVPDALIGHYGGHTTSFYYFYMWRFGWVFYLMALFFEVCAFFASFLACCGRLGAGIGSLVALLALFFLSLAVSLMTATFVKARNVFRHNGHSAQLGTYAFGFSWAAWAALFLAVLLLCVGTGRGRSAGPSGRRSKSSRDDAANGVAHDIANGNATPFVAHAGAGRRWGRRGRSSKRSRGSFSKGHYAHSQDTESV